MALSNSQYNAVMREYEKRQLKNRHERDARIARVYQQVPQLKQLEQEISAQAAACARQSLSGSLERTKEMKAQLEEMRLRRKELLKNSGFPEDYMEMRYTCPDCKDTGFADGKRCHCFERARMRILYAQSGIEQALERENFSHFSYDYFDDTKIDPRSGKTARAYMEQVTAFCHRYVDGFKEEKGNILFTGKTGLGKTFLSNCIAKELIERCFSVVYLPAVEMYEIFSRDRFANDATDEDRDRSQYLLECDLLIIDDLGTELVNTFTTSQLFYVVNERLNRKKGTIISTNLPVNEMRDEFTDRVMSRIISQYQIIPLYGEDIRIRKKLENR